MLGYTGTTRRAQRPIPQLYETAREIINFQSVAFDDLRIVTADIPYEAPPHRQSCRAVGRGGIDFHRRFFVDISYRAESRQTDHRSGGWYH